MVGWPTVTMRSLTAIGTPASGVQLLGRGAAGGADGVHLGGDGERLLGVDVQEGVDALPAVDGGDAVQVGLGDLDGGDLAGGQLLGELRRRERRISSLFSVMVSLLIQDRRDLEPAVVGVRCASARACSW